MNKTIFLSILTIFSIASMASAGTWAFFSDAEASGLNTFTAGTLALDVLTTSAASDGTRIVPGKSVSGSIVIKNEGDIAGDLYLKMSSETNALLNDFTVTTTVDGNERDLNDHEYIKIGTLGAGELIDLPLKYYMNEDATGNQGTTEAFVFDVALMQQGAPAPTHPQL
ncbi:TasA family protein [uncultured Methanomethylovorans sp.]|uniref:TasA family protein n=1 Tax=uncultured Methanomethylovorans sp. TaxID=183759 RepID=UPI002AA93876|nr:TasA family protein [uncultured Methanomethylovorans sp.]